MQRRQAELNAEGWGAEAVDGLHIGVGVNTGRVIAGAVGGGGRLEYTVIGDAVNVAQRLQSEADGGEVVASATTVAAAGSIRVEAIGPRVVKGREEPIEVFRVLEGSSPSDPARGRVR
jgi:class 3 adenylate cyclase